MAIIAKLTSCHTAMKKFKKKTDQVELPNPEDDESDDLIEQPVDA